MMKPVSEWGLRKGREREKKINQKNAIEAALRPLNDEGYYSIIMKKIMKHPDLSRSALRFYSKTKDKIFINGIVSHTNYFKKIFIKFNPKTLSKIIWPCFLRITQLERSRQVLSRKHHFNISQHLAIICGFRRTIQHGWRLRNEADYCFSIEWRPLFNCC